MGLYYDYSQKLMDMAEKVVTPFGPLFILTGSRAREYYEFHNYADEFSKKKRILAAEALFGEFQFISNETHQRLVNMNEIALGCHLLPKDDPDRILPFVLRADLPAYLVKGKPSLGDAEIESLGFTRRSQRLGVENRLKQANIIPHGAGYTFPDLLNVSQCWICQT